MCIRDSYWNRPLKDPFTLIKDDLLQGKFNLDESSEKAYLCLLYTSDAADERSSVDLGGRRIIKKKNT